MRRRMRIPTALIPVLLVAAPAGATRIEFVWADTGTSHISVLPGAEIVLEARVVVEDPGIWGVAVSALATPGLLEAVGFEVCPLVSGNLLAGGCGADFGTLLSPIGVNNVVLNQQNAGSPGGAGFDPTPIPGLSGSFAAVRPPPGHDGPADGTFVLAHITYAVNGVGSGQVLPYYRGGVDGALENGSDFFIPLADGADVTSGVSFAVIPEPGAIGLLAAGLLALSAYRRRHCGVPTQA